MNKLPELTNRDLKKLEERFDIANAEVLSSRIAHLTHMKVLVKTDHFAPWMRNWVHWDDTVGTYVGCAPDNEVIACATDPLEFLKKYKEASSEWQRQEDLIQKGL